MLRFLLCFALAAAPSAAVPSTPSFLEPPLTGSHPGDVHMHVGGYSDSEGDPHASTSWEIRTVPANQLVWQAVSSGLELTHVHFGNGTFVGPYAGRTSLEFDTDYRLDVRFTDNQGQQGPPGSRTFRTSAAGPPGISGPLPWIPFEPGYRVEVVAGGFDLPVNIAFHPNPGPNPTDPYFYVSELYGTIKVVRRNGTASTFRSGLLNYDPKAFSPDTFPGKGEQGLTGICVDPSSLDVFAALLWENDADPGPGVTLERWPRVVRLHSADGGLTAGAPTLVKDFPNEPQGQSHQISNLTIGPDGRLYVHLGDGFTPSTAQNLSSYRGKILRMNLDGSVPAGNPFAVNGTARDYVFAYGLRNPFGGAWRESDGTHYKVENGNGIDNLARVPAGRNFNWNSTANDAGSIDTQAIYVWNPARAPVNLAFVQPGTFFGSGFPAVKQGHAYVTESGPTYASGPQARGKRIVEFTLGTGDNAPAAGPTTFVEYAGTGQATAAGLAAGPDGLYWTDLYKDQPATPLTVNSPFEVGGQVLRARFVGVPANGTGTGFEGYYFNNTTLADPPARQQTDATVNFSWGSAPAPGVNADNFSVRWLGRIEPRTSDVFTFYVQVNGGVRLWVNGTAVIDQWTIGTGERAGTISLQAGTRYDVVLEFQDTTGTAEARLRWSGPAQPKEAVPTTQLYAPDLRDNDGDGLVNTRDFDDDADGTPDNADTDLDGDGHSNAAEVAASTDPNDKLSFPATPPPSGGGGGGGGGGGCGLTGLEIFLLLYLIGIWKAN